MQAKAQEAFQQYVKEREASKGEKKPSVMEYLGLKKKVSDLQEIAHAMQMKVLFSLSVCLWANCKMFPVPWQRKVNFFSIVTIS